MWHTSMGKRTLSGPEADLVRGVIGFMYDQIDDMYGYDDYTSGVETFDRLHSPQQLALLAEVASGLLTENYPPPELTAVRAATVAAVYSIMVILVETEIDSEQFDDPERDLREQLLAVYGTDDVDGKLPEPACVDIGQWEGMIEAIQGRVLPDEDWDMEDLFMDASPERSAAMKAMLRISDNYFTDVPPDPSAAELENIRVKLNELTGARHPAVITGDDTTEALEHVEKSVYDRVADAVLLNVNVPGQFIPSKIEREDAVEQCLAELRSEDETTSWQIIVELALQRLATAVCNREITAHFVPGSVPEADDGEERTPPHWRFDSVE